MGIGERSLLLVELQGHLADVDAALSVLVYGDGLAVEVVGVAQRLEVGVAVSAKHQVDAARVAYHLLVAHAALVPSEMRYADDEVALLLAQQVGHLLCRGHGV